MAGCARGERGPRVTTVPKTSDKLALFHQDDDGVHTAAENADVHIVQKHKHEFLPDRLEDRRRRSIRSEE